MNEVDLANWLFEHGGPAIRYRTAVELLNADQDLGGLRTDLLDSPLVRRWLDRLQPALGFNQLHGATTTSYENVMGKLTQLGCCRGMPPLDEKTRAFREWFQEVAATLPGSNYTWTPFLRILVGAFLSRAGYWDEGVLQDYLDYRLEVLYQLARQRRYDLYVDPATCAGIPKPFRGRPLIDPALTPGGEMRFPLIYDIHLLANVPGRLKTAATHEKINSVIAYILDPAYQSLPEGYGILRAKRQKYYAMGWSVHLPGYGGMAVDHPRAGSFIQRLVLMSNFSTARGHRWYKEGVRFLEEFRTEKGTYRFPRVLLPEKRSGYWVTGAYMGLEDNRRTKFALELESTFWMLKLMVTGEN